MQGVNVPDVPGDAAASPAVAPPPDVAEPGESARPGAHDAARLLDHRDLGRDLDVFAAAEPVGSGLPLWLPAGAAVVGELERYIRALEHQAGYQQVRTPALAKRELYETSGHWRYFADDLFPVMSMAADGAPDGEDLVLRPVMCPHHALVYRSRSRSYRELPLRLAEFGPQYRRERSGVLSGLTRVRAMTLNDGHHFCAPHQVVDEVVQALEMIDRAYADLGIEADHVRLSLRDDSAKFAGEDQAWQQAEAWLRAALAQRGSDFVVGVGEAAFYGPKIDIQVLDAGGKDFTLSTVQVDLHQPRRFGLEYVAADASRQRPVMVHRSALSSMERMVAYLLESYGGALPAWLAPVQVVWLPITADQVAAAHAARARCLAAGLRAEVDDRDESLGARIRRAQHRKIPYLGVIGAREADAGSVAIRSRSGARLPERPIADFVCALAELTAARRKDLHLDR